MGRRSQAPGSVAQWFGHHPSCVIFNLSETVFSFVQGNRSSPAYRAGVRIKRDDGARCSLSSVPGTWGADGLSLSSAILTPWGCSPVHVSAKSVQTATQPDLVCTCYLPPPKGQGPDPEALPQTSPSHTQQGGKGGGAGQGFSVLELESRLLSSKLLRPPLYAPQPRALNRGPSPTGRGSSHSPLLPALPAL